VITYETLALDEEHPRGQALLSRRLHRQSVGVLTSRAALPRTASAFAIACREQRGRAGRSSPWLLSRTKGGSLAGASCRPVPSGSGVIAGSNPRAT
jgi:hypothetical protein